MTDQAGSIDRARAAVVARDEALRQSLVLLLDLCGFQTTGFVDAGEFLGRTQLAELFVFIDAAPNEIGGLAEIDEMRRRGWLGSAVFMAEDEPPPNWRMPQGPCFLLVKPFAADDVLAVIQA